MKRATFFVYLIAVPIAAVAAEPEARSVTGNAPGHVRFSDAEKSELAKLEGKWTLVAQTVDGSVNPEPFESYTLTFDDQFVTISYRDDSRGHQSKHRFTVNPVSSPMQMNWFDESPLIQSVCERKSHRLTIANFGRPEVARPSNVDTEAAGDSACFPKIVWVLRRE